MATNKKARRFEDLTFSDVLTRELPGDPLTPSGPSVPPWAVMQAPHIFTRPATITSPDTQSPGPAGTNNFFDSSITQAASPDAVVRSVRRVAGAFYTYIYPEPLPTPTLCAWSPSAFALLDLQGPPSLNEVKHDVHAQYRRYVMAQMLSGSKILQGCLPYAANYGGHQFGYYAGQLGDGRCVSLGRVFMPPAKEIVGAGVAAGEKESAGARFSWEMNVKGAGRTPYSRFGDGYQILSAGIREFLGSETLAALGIPTTRSLALIGSSRPLKRDDNATPQSASAVARLAPSWIRFGTFELSHYRSEKTMVRALANYLLQHHFPEIDARYGSAIVSDPATSRSTSPQGKAVKLPKITVVRTIDFDESATNVKVMVEGAATMEAEMNRYAMLFGEIVKRSAVMVAHWQAQGFCHGVLNTDNMSVLGITIDFGPFGFLDSYDPLWTANISDSDGKYAFAKQPHTVLDNLSKLGRVFVELVEIPANQAEILEPVSLSSSLNGGNLSGLPRLSTAHPRSSTAGPRLSAPGTRVSTAVGQAAGTEVGRTPKTPGSSLLAEPGGLSRPKPKGSEIIKAILDTYESRFIDEYSAIMRKKLGFKTSKDDDLECFVNPLLQLMADSLVDYTLFFRELCNFRTSPPEIVTAQLSPSAKTSCKCLSLMLESLEYERRNLRSPRASLGSLADVSSSMLDGSRPQSEAQETENETKHTNLTDVGESRASTRPVSSEDIPTEEEIVARWSEWASLYHKRLLEESKTPSTGNPSEQALPKPPPSGLSYDWQRTLLMRRVNPRYVLRGWIIHEVCEKLMQEPSLQPKDHSAPVESGKATGRKDSATEQPVRRTRTAAMASGLMGTPKTAGKKEDAGKDDQIPPEAKVPFVDHGGFAHIERVMRVLVRDIWGEIAESDAGWKDEEDRKAAERWAATPPEWGRNTTVSCIS